MKLKNILIVVEDLERSKEFYKNLFGLDTVLDQEGNVILTEGLVLQDKKVWREAIRRKIADGGNNTMLYFEERDLKRFLAKVEESEYDIEYIGRDEGESDEVKQVRFYDPDGHLIEVREPNN